MFYIRFPFFYIWKWMILKMYVKKIYKYKLKKDMLEEYSRLPYNYQSKIGYDTLIQNVIFKEMVFFND